MSRGLGKLQREILDSLEDSRNVFHRFGEKRDDGSVIVRHHGEHSILPEGIYDVMALKDLLVSRETGWKGRGWQIDLSTAYWAYTPEFESSFHRAIRTLIKRGWLEEAFRFEVEADGSLGKRIGMRRRFIQRPMCSVSY